MSSFSFVDFDSILDAAASAIPSSGSSSARPPSLLAASSASSSTHGESSAFVDIGSSLLGGSGGCRCGGHDGNSGGILEATSKSPSKRVGLVLDPSPELLCMGQMSTAKICTRSLLDDGKTCGAISHGKKFQPPALAAFVKDTEIRALCQPVLDLSFLSPTQQLRIQGVNLTADEWVHLFQLIKQRTPPKWLAVDDSQAITLDTQVSSPSIEFLSPTNVDNGRLLTTIPMLTSFDDSVALEDGGEPELSLEDVTAFIHKFCSHFLSFKHKWHRAFTEVKSGYGLLVQDLQRLHSVAQAHSHSMGQPSDFVGDTPDSLWQGFLVVHESVATMTAADRTGLGSTFEARVASSVQNLFPSVFSKSDSNVDTAEALPALTSPEKWDSNDGNTGVRY
jgi:hypothetical protein